MEDSHFPTFKMEDDLHFFKMEDDLNFFQIESDLNIMVGGRQPQKMIMQSYAIKSKTMVVEPLLVTYFLYF